MPQWIKATRKLPHHGAYCRRKDVKYFFSEDWLPMLRGNPAKLDFEWLDENSGDFSLADVEKMVNMAVEYAQDGSFSKKQIFGLIKLQFNIIG